MLFVKFFAYYCVLKELEADKNFVQARQATLREFNDFLVRDKVSSADGQARKFT